MGLMTGCNVSTHSTTTTTVTDAEGNTKTTVVDNKTGNESYHGTISFDNSTDDSEFTELYFYVADTDNCKDNLLEETLLEDETIHFNGSFTHDDEHMLWDMKVVDQNNNEVTFDHLDLSTAEDQTDILVTITTNTEGGLMASIQ